MKLGKVTREGVLCGYLDFRIYSLFCPYDPGLYFGAVEEESIVLVGVLQFDNA